YGHGAARPPGRCRGDGAPAKVDACRFAAGANSAARAGSLSGLHTDPAAPRRWRRGRAARPLPQEIAPGAQPASQRASHGHACSKLGHARIVGFGKVGQGLQTDASSVQPVVNAGAIAVAALMPGDTAEQRIATMLDLFSNLAGRKLEIDEQVFQSEN